MAFFFTIITIAFIENIEELLKLYSVSNNRRQYLSLLKLFLTNCFISHIVGIMALGIAEIRDGPVWTSKYDIITEYWFERYCYGLYWGTTIITTVGFGDITVANPLEAIFVSIVMMIGCLVISYSISQVGTIVGNLAEKGEVLKRQLSTLSNLA